MKIEELRNLGIGGLRDLGKNGDGGYILICELTDAMLFSTSPLRDTNRHMQVCSFDA
jgi:hypothetical protein